MDEEFRALVKKGKKTEAEAESMIQLANEVQYSILTKKLQPGKSRTNIFLFLSVKSSTLSNHQLCVPSTIVQLSNCLAMHAFVSLSIRS